MHGRKERINPLQRELDKGLEDLRDDCIALFINSKLKQIDISRLGGPTPGTISKWLNHETHFPRLSTIQSFTAALGYAVEIVPGLTAKKHRQQPIEYRLELQTPITLKRGRPRLPIKARMDARKARAKGKIVKSRTWTQPIPESDPIIPQFIS